jgi:hypothetical protein
MSKYHEVHVVSGLPVLMNIIQNPNIKLCFINNPFLEISMFLEASALDRNSYTFLITRHIDRCGTAFPD